MVDFELLRPSTRRRRAEFGLGRKPTRAEFELGRKPTRPDPWTALATIDLPILPHYST